jgi:hypothetical protein
VSVRAKMKILLLMSLSFYYVYILLEFNFGEKDSVTFVAFSCCSNCYVQNIKSELLFYRKNEQNLTCVDVLPFTPLLFFLPMHPNQLMEKTLYIVKNKKMVSFTQTLHFGTI